MRRARLASLLLCLAGFGCEQATEVLVRVRAEDGLEVRQVTVRARFEDGSEDEATLGADALPFTVPIGPQGPRGGEIDIQVRAELQSMPPLIHDARVEVQGGRTSLLDVELSSRCLAANACGAGETCNRCGCEPVERGRLPVVEGDSVEPNEPLGACVEPPEETDGGQPDSTVDGETEMPEGGGEDAEIDAGEAGPQQTGDAGSADSCKTRACVRALSLGDGHACFIAEGGELLCWGEGGDGQLGRGDLPPGRRAIGRAGSASDWRRVSVSPLQTCATRSGDEAYCWGDVLGDLDIQVPDKAGAAEAPRGLEAGAYWACGLQNDGSVDCWGAYPGIAFATVLTLDDPTGGAEWAALVDTTTHIHMLDDQNNLWSLINQTYTLERSGVRQAVRNGAHCYLLVDDTLRCGGRNDFGQAGLGATSAEVPEGEVQVQGVTFTQVAGSAEGTCALDQAGGVWCWGNNSHGMLGPEASGQLQMASPIQVAPPPPGDPYVQVEVGVDTVCAVRDSGFVDCWGGSEPVVFGPAGAPLRLPNQ